MGEWNVLPENVVYAGSVNVLKNRLDAHLVASGRIERFYDGSGSLMRTLSFLILIQLN